MFLNISQHKEIQMIKWLAHKVIDWKDIQNILSPCEKSNQFTNIGPVIPECENYIRQKFQIRDDKAVILTSNGTTAIHAIVGALQTRKFYTQAFTFPSSVQGPLIHSTIADIDLEGGLNLDQIQLSSHNGIIVTNIHGNVTNISKYEDYCREHKQFLLFDNAATGMTFYKGQNSCNYGNASTVSFHHTKPFGFGEGGCIIIDREYEKAVRLMLNFGIDNTLGDRAMYSPHGSNYRMCDINAAFILSYLRNNMDRIVQRHKEIYELVEKNLPEHFELFPNFSDGTPVCSSICLLHKKGPYSLEKLTFCVRKYYKPLAPLPVSMDFYSRIVCLPCNVDLTDEDVLFMLSAL